jgi:DNA-binding beta-propeller fold protein YncE
MNGLLACSIWLIGCGDDGLGEGSAQRGPSDGANAGAGGTAGVGSPVGGMGGGMASGGSSGVPVLPPEVEVKLDFELPQASESFVYAANPEGGTVSIINAESRQIQTLETGEQPTFLRTLAGTDDAIVLNVGSDDATIIRNPDGRATTSNVAVIRGANAIAVAPDGKHAVVYFNASFSTAGNASGSLQDVSVLKLEVDHDAVIDMTVGFRPRDVFFASDGSAAYVVTEDGISVLDFEDVEADGSGIAPRISLGDDIVQKTLDVSITPSGEYALARQPGESEIRLVNLRTREITPLDLATVLPAIEEEASDEDGGVPPEPAPVEITDLDLAASGTVAAAVLRNQSSLVVLPIPGAFEDAGTISIRRVEDTVVGSATLAPDGKTALLYTTAAAVEHITVVDLENEAEKPRTLALRKAVRAVAIAPDSQTALVLHEKAEGDPNEPGIDPDVAIDRMYGYSGVRISNGAVKLQQTATPPGAFTVVPDGSAIFVLFRDDALAVREVQRIDTTSFLVTPTRLASPPISVGSVPQTDSVFVSQDHPEGRITFIDWKDGQKDTVTGFELNSRIRD